MDFSRAKTVLIAAFLLLNLFLFYQLWEAEGAGRFGLFSDEEDRFHLEEELKEVNLTLQTSLPQNAAKSSHLEVMPWTFEVEEVVHYLWAALKEDDHSPSIDNENEFPLEKIEENNQGRKYRLGDYKMEIEREGTLELKAEDIVSDVKRDASTEDIQKAAENFKEQLPFMEDFDLDYKELRDEYTVLHYWQQVEDTPLFAGYAEIVMCGKQIYKFKFYRLEKQEFAEQKRESIPPSTALIRFIEDYKEDSTPAAIIDFQHGYYSKKYDAERWEIPPVWRIRLDTNEYYYVNAFTGNLEK